MSDQDTLDKFISVKQATRLMDYKSRNSINVLVHQGKLDCLVLFRGTSCEMRVFYRDEVMTLAHAREDAKTEKLMKKMRERQERPE